MSITKERWSSCVLRIYSERISTDIISSKLNSLPTRHYNNGDPISKRNPNSKLRKENLWLLESPLSDQDPLEMHIGYLLTFLEDNKAGFMELHGDCEYDIRCAYFSMNGQGGFVLGHHLLERLTAFPIELVVGLYPPGEIPEL